MANQFLKLRRSSVPGKRPDTGSLDYGEIALNTYDGLAFMKKSGSNGEEVIAIGATGSFSGSFTGSINAVQGTTNYVPFFNTNTSLANSIIYQTSSFIAINETNVNSAAPEALYVFQLSTSSYNVISGKGNLNHYLQLNIQNTNQGISASSDVVATAHNGNENTNYINMGINSVNYTHYLGGPNDAYLYATASNLLIGSTHDGGNVYFFNSSSLKPLITLTSTGSVEITSSLFSVVGNTQIIGSVNVNGALIVTGGVTGSLFGTASWAQNALTASYIPASAIPGLNLARISTGSITASVDVDPNNLFLIKSGSNTYFNIASNSNTTLYSDQFTVRNFTNQNPVLTVSQSIVQFNTQSVDPTNPAVPGGIWFTSTTMYVGLE